MPAKRTNHLALKPLCLAGSLATSIALAATPSLAKVTDLGHTDLADPITAEAGESCYLITAITDTPASNAQWGEAEEGRNFANTPWALNGDSAALAGLHTEYAFIANPSYWGKNDRTRPANATYVLTPNPPDNVGDDGLLYYQGDSQLHYTTGTNNGKIDASNKVIFYLGQTLGTCDSTSPGGGKDIADILEGLPENIRDAITTRLKGSTKTERLVLLGRLVDALLLPRNVVAAGGLATQAYVNDLADTILERLPSRQFQKIQIDEEITETEIEGTITEPVRGLWKTSKSGTVDVEIASIEINGDFYVENPNLTSIYTEPNGTRVWARGFGGSKQPYSTGGAYGKRGAVYYQDVYNNFYSTHGGVVVGVDTSLSDNIQLGLFGNYGNINLQQYSGLYTGSGSWNPSGFGGGVMASYWEDNFYLQGLFGATAFSGDNKRRVKLGTVLDETYTATKATTSYVGALRAGAPIAWGGLIIEPQATAIWNHNQDASYTESGRFRALALKLHAFSDHFLETTLGAKFAWPIKQGNRNLLVPNFKVAWLADWDTNNGSVKFERAYSRLARTATGEIPSNQETQNGVLVEGGLDYSIFQNPTSAWKLYAKGGAKIWVDANTDWRASGGITFQF